MDKAESEKKSELKELLEELAQINTADQTITANKPWWLQEESLLGEVNLDYDELKQDTKLEISKRKEEGSDNKPVDSKRDSKLEIEIEEKENGDSKPVQKVELKLKDNKTLPVNKSARIPMKEMHEGNAQGQTPEDATSSGGAVNRGRNFAAERDTTRSRTEDGQLHHPTG